MATVEGIYSGGIDWGPIIDKMVQIKTIPLQRLSQKQLELSDKKVKLQDLSSTLSNFSSSIFNLTLESTFKGYTASSSNEDVATASVVSANPLIGTFSVEVNQVATNTQVKSDSVMGGSIDPTNYIAAEKFRDTITTGSFTINGVKIDIDPNSESLNDIIDKINNSGAGVVASYDSDTDKLTIKNANTGDNTKIVLGADGDTSNFLQVVGLIDSYQATDADGTGYVEGKYHLGAVNPKKLLKDTNFATAITAGTFKINGVEFSVDPETETLEDVMNKINNSNANVTAWYDPVEDALVLRSKTTGSPLINLEDGTSNFLSATNVLNATQEAGQDAQITINGTTLTSNENSFEYGGIKIDVKDTGTFTMTVSQNVDKAVAAVKGFIDGYNKIIDQINQLVKDKKSPLYMDSTIRSIADRFNSIVFSPLATTNKINDITDIGIHTSEIDLDSDEWKEGSYLPKLELDEDKLKEAIQNNPDQVYQLFAMDEGDLAGQKGIAKQLREYIDSLTNATGSLTQRIKMTDDDILDIDERIDKMNKEIEDYRQKLILEYSKLDTKLGELNSQNQWLSAQLASITGTSTTKK